MTTWNYRLIDLTRSGEDDRYIEIREVYYDDKGRITGWTGGVAVGGADKAEVKCVLSMMAHALRKPILKESELINLTNRKEKTMPTASTAKKNPKIPPMTNRRKADLKAKSKAMPKRTASKKPVRAVKKGARKR